MQNVQGSVTVYRLRTGDSILLTLNPNKPLRQYVDEATGSVAPNWSDSNNQPTITPEIKSVRYGATGITLKNIVWKYNSVELKKNSDGKWKANGFAPEFAINETTGALTICSDLASKENIASDTLEFSCVAVFQGIENSLAKDIVVDIAKLTASGYYGSVTATTMQLDDLTTSTKLTAHLSSGGADVTNFIVKWVKADGKAAGGTANGHELTLQRDDVNGMEWFFAEFRTQTGGNVVAKAGVLIHDNADEYHINLSASGFVAPKQPVTVTASLQRLSGAPITDLDVAWELNIYNPTTWGTSLGSSKTNQIEVTTDHTDKKGTQSDVVVVAKAEISPKVVS